MLDDSMISMILEPFDWDKKSYRFNREEKDMHPYSIHNSAEQTVIVHNVLGINKEDLKLSKRIENGISYIVIEGKTKDSITNKEYSISSRFALDDSCLDLTKISSNTKNGLLYIIIPVKKSKPKNENIQITIL